MRTSATVSLALIGVGFILLAFKQRKLGVAFFFLALGVTLGAAVNELS